MAPSECNPFINKTMEDILTGDESGDDEEDIPTPVSNYSNTISTPRRSLIDVILTSNVRRRLFSYNTEVGKSFLQLCIVLLKLCYEKFFLNSHAMSLFQMEMNNCRI